MNKALIKKYKAEFDHWINGGELLIGYKSKFEPVEWNVLVEDDWDYCISKFTIVINDYYVEFRKALTEGKTIQTKLLSSEYPSAITNAEKRTEWIDFDVETNKFMGYSKYYRIKPKEEQQFNVGDFVRYKNIQNGKAMMINNINCGYYYMINSEKAFMAHELIKWEPKCSELCWFTNNKELNIGYIGEFLKTNDYGVFFDIMQSSWSYCEPFLNSKPFWFKD